MDLASVVAALASVGVRVSGSTPNNNIQGDSSRACPTGLAGPEPSGTHNDPGQHFHPFLPNVPPFQRSPHIPRPPRFPPYPLRSPRTPPPPQFPHGSGYISALLVVVPCPVHDQKPVRASH